MENKQILRLLLNSLLWSFFFYVRRTLLKYARRSIPSLVQIIDIFASAGLILFLFVVLKRFLGG